MLNTTRIQPTNGPLAPPKSHPTLQPSTSFADVLGTKLATATRGLKFSAHATQRMAERNIQLSPQDKARIEHALDNAAEKNARETLLLMDRLAFVVSVPNRTVITVVPQSELEDMVFTNIDSAVVVGKPDPLPTR